MSFVICRVFLLAYLIIIFWGSGVFYYSCEHDFTASCLPTHVIIRNIMVAYTYFSEELIHIWHHTFELIPAAFPQCRLIVYSKVKKQTTSARLCLVPLFVYFKRHRYRWSSRTWLAITEDMFSSIYELFKEISPTVKLRNKRDTKGGKITSWRLSQVTLLSPIPRTEMNPLWKSTEFMIKIICKK